MKISGKFILILALITMQNVWGQNRVPLIYAPQQEQKSRPTQVIDTESTQQGLRPFSGTEIPAGKLLLRKKIHDVPSYWGLFLGKMKLPLPNDLHSYLPDSSQAMSFFKDVRLFADSNDALAQHLPGEVAELYFDGQHLLIRRHPKLWYLKNGQLRSITAQQQLPAMVSFHSGPAEAKVFRNGQMQSKSGEAFILPEPGYHLFHIEIPGHYNRQILRYTSAGEILQETVPLLPLPMWKDGTPVLPDLTLPEPGRDIAWVNLKIAQEGATQNQNQNVKKSTSSSPATKTAINIHQLRMIRQQLRNDTLSALVNIENLYIESYDSESATLPFLLNVGNQQFDFMLEGALPVSAQEAQMLLWHLSHEKEQKRPIFNRRFRSRKAPFPEKNSRNAWVQISYINQQARARRHERDQFMFFDITGVRLLLPRRSYELKGNLAFPTFIKNSPQWQERINPLNR